MKNTVLLLLLMAQFSWGQAPGPQIISLKCEASPSAIGDIFEYDFKIETKAGGVSELKEGSKLLLKPLNISESMQSAWQKISVQTDRIEMSAITYNRLLEHKITEKFIFDRKNNEFTLARTTQDISKESADSGLIQLQSGTCIEH